MTTFRITFFEPSLVTGAAPSVYAQIEFEAKDAAAALSSALNRKDMFVPAHAKRRIVVEEV